MSGVSLQRRATVTVVQLVLSVYVVVLVASALDAHQLWSVPLPWLAQALAISTVIALGILRPIQIVPGTRAFLWLLLWAAVVTLVNGTLEDYVSLMPRLATVSYPIYLSLRFATILSFLAVVYLVCWLLARGRRDSLIKWTVLVATGLSIVAVYVYVAQVYGLPDLPRNRPGTGGEVQATSFTYMFHRAMGTFREPSHLAEWLVVPFFLSVVGSRNVLNFHTIVIGSVVLLTGSLTGILGTLLGFLTAAFLMNPWKTFRLRKLGGMLGVVFLSVAVFRVLAVPYEEGGTDLLAVIAERVDPVLVGGGLSASNRGYVYDYVSQASVPLLGTGLGHANLLFADFLNSSVIPSFLSLYVNVVLSLGLVGAALLVYGLVAPIRKLMSTNRLARERETTWILGAYAAWLWMFAVRAEEVSTMFGIAFALLISQVVTGRRRAVGRERSL